MDWLSKHRAIVDCYKKAVVFKCFDLSEVIVYDIQSGPVSNLLQDQNKVKDLHKVES